jgi:hypothetical protein
MNARKVSHVGRSDRKGTSIGQTIFRKAKRNPLVKADNLLDVVQQANQLLSRSFRQ